MPKRQNPRTNSNTFLFLSREGGSFKYTFFALKFCLFVYMLYVSLLLTPLSFVYLLKSPDPSCFGLLSHQLATCIDDECNYVLTWEEVPDHTSTLPTMLGMDDGGEEDFSNGEFSDIDGQEWFFNKRISK